MRTYPLDSISIDLAKDIQFSIVEEITKEFEGLESLSRGDLGVRQPGNIPRTTSKVEHVITNVFHAESAMLLRGSGTNALRQVLSHFCREHKKILLHDAPIYPTTKTTLDLIGAEIVYADFNNTSEIEVAINKHPDIHSALVQITRQKMEDAYDAKEVISKIKAMNHKIQVVTDDNYAVFKRPKIGCEIGADVSTFSTFKLLGPAGIGCVVGRKDIIQALKKMNYSGGSQVQGYEALDVLSGFVYAPVSLAIQATVIDEVYEYIHRESIPGIDSCFIANAQSKVLIVKLRNHNAQDVLREAEKLGALPHPVGAESKYELAPMFYRASGTFIKENKDAINQLIRINPNRAGASTVIRILKEAINNA